MVTDDEVPAHAPTGDRIGLTGARFRARSPGDGPRPPAVPGRFETALRGYARREVDAHLARQEERIRGLEDALRDSERRRAAVEAHAAVLESELAAARADRLQRPAEPEHSSVADGLLRQARREAARVRVEAAEAARRLLDDAQAEAARTRERAERTAADWTARVEQHLARRLAEVEVERLPDAPAP